MANTVTYGAHKFHRYHTLTSHCYMSRGLFLNRAAHDAWPEPLRAAFARAVTGAISLQRDLAVAEEESARRAIENEGGEIIELAPAEREAFVRAVAPMHDAARKRFGNEMFDWL